MFGDRIDELGLSLGIDQRIGPSLEAHSLGHIAREVSSEYPAEIVRDNGVTVFPDGLAVALDERWSEEKMSLDSITRPQFP